MTDEPRSTGQHWEFKFLRFPLPFFRDAEGLQNVLSDEAAAGWMLVEKFDDKRVRLKRPVSARDHDESLDWDPYRTMTPSMVKELKRLGRRNLTVIGVVTLLTATIGLVVGLAINKFF